MCAVSNVSSSRTLASEASGRTRPPIETQQDLSSLTISGSRIAHSGDADISIMKSTVRSARFETGRRDPTTVADWPLTQMDRPTIPGSPSKAVLEVVGPAQRARRRSPSCRRTRGLGAWCIASMKLSLTSQPFEYTAVAWLVPSRLFSMSQAT